MTVTLKAVEEYRISFTPENQDAAYHMTLSRADAKQLYSLLKWVLGMDTPPVTHYPRGSKEPDVPLGTRLKDDSGDILVKQEKGWRWSAIGGTEMHGSPVISWDEVKDLFSFEVIN